MSELRAEPLSPIDAATLWPQLGRLSTEVIATRGGENLLVTSGLAATGLTHLPKMPRTSVLGVRRGLGYRGVCVARELAGGAAWEVDSLRIAREKDDEAITALCDGVAEEIARRGGRTAYLRFAEGSPHARALRQGGFMAYRIEHLYAVGTGSGSAETPFRPATRADRHGVFRLYCRAVPEVVRRNEAPTQQDWRAVLDSFDTDREYVVDIPEGFSAWVGIGERESYVMLDDSSGELLEAALNLVEQHAGRHGTLVIAEHQISLESAAVERGYPQLGVRLMSARRLAVLNPLKEVVPVAADSVALPQ